MADLNQDNNLDVAVAMGGGDRVAMLLPGNGDGTFDDVIILLLTEESAPQDIVAEISTVMDKSTGSGGGRRRVQRISPSYHRRSHIF